MRKLSRLCNPEQKYQKISEIFFSENLKAFKVDAEAVETMKEAFVVTTKLLLRSQFLNENGDLGWKALSTTITNQIEKKAEQAGVIVGAVAAQNARAAAQHDADTHMI